MFYGLFQLLTLLEEMFYGLQLLVLQENKLFFYGL
jgi:hypothetical protein